MVALFAASALSLAGGASHAQEISFFMGPYSAQTPANMETIVTNFQAANPGVTVSYQSAPWETYDEKITTAARAGDGPAENGSAKVCHGSGGIVLLRAE
jgi:multiple sugar transport system substrate-binding protein